LWPLLNIRALFLFFTISKDDSNFGYILGCCRRRFQSRTEQLVYSRIRRRRIFRYGGKNLPNCDRSHHFLIEKTKCWGWKGSKTPEMDPTDQETLRIPGRIITSLCRKGINFTNNLRSAFLCKEYCEVFSTNRYCLCNFLAKEYQWADRKKLMKITKGCRSRFVCKYHGRITSPQTPFRRFPHSKVT